MRSKVLVVKYFHILILKNLLLKINILVTKAGSDGVPESKIFKNRQGQIL